MAASNRPLSPHLQVYRPQITSIISIMHRITGVALAGGTLLFTYWLAAAAYGPASFDRAQALMGSWFGLLILCGFTFSLYFHFANGIRHLFWDVGRGFEMGTVRKSGWFVAIFSVVATAITWFFVCPWTGGA